MNDSLLSNGELQEKIAELKAENDRLKEEIKKIRENKCTDCIQHLITKSHKLALEKANKVFKTLQEIKEYLNTLSGIDNDFVNTETYLRILDLITKAEGE